MFSTFIGELSKDVRCTDCIAGFKDLPITRRSAIIKSANLDASGNVPGETALKFQDIDASPPAAYEEYQSTQNRTRRSSEHIELSTEAWPSSWISLHRIKRSLQPPGDLIGRICAQKCMKYTCGSAWRRWLCRAVIWMPCLVNALATRFTSSAVMTKSPVAAVSVFRILDIDRRSCSHARRQLDAAFQDRLR